MHIQTPFLRNIISMAVGQLIKKKGYRTAAYNATVAKAAKYSQHLYGKAADIQVQGISVEQVYAYADKLLAGRGGVGIYPPGLGRANGWVHVDVRKEKSRWRG